MVKSSTVFSCNACGSIYNKWSGRCDSCGEWNTISEETSSRARAPGGLKGNSGKSKTKLEFVSLKGETAGPPRWTSGIAEFDRVTGGGLVPGSGVLIGGDPGIGKSTLLLQAAAALANQKLRVAYISGEEAVEQIRMRASRLGVADAPVELAAETSVRNILSAIDKPNAPHIAVIDSIQTLFLDSLESAPGTVSQVRGAAQELIRAAKQRGFALLLVGHVTKEGTIAGPKVVEHMVDAVLYFEGDRSHQFRILRAIKNRFGPAHEIGVFEMVGQGLQEVSNPSALFLSERREDISGSAVFAGVEGSRPVLVEVQALVAPSTLATPRRAVVGWDSARLAMVLAVLEARCGLSLSSKEVYLNIAGGLRINEPAADLAVAAALISSVSESPISEQTVIIGEIGLGGEIRSVAHLEQRLREASKLGFRQAWIPEIRQKERSSLEELDIGLKSFGHVRDMLQSFVET